MFSATACSNSAVEIPSSPPHVKTSGSSVAKNWPASITQKFIDEVAPFKAALGVMLVSELRFSKEQSILEVGSGPSGGIGAYLPEKLHECITLTEPSEIPEEHFKRLSPSLQKLAQKTMCVSADRLPSLGKRFSTIVAINVMDCILGHSMDAGMEALKGMKNVLTPGGQIKLIHYLGPTGTFIKNAREAETQHLCHVFPVIENVFIEKNDPKKGPMKFLSPVGFLGFLLLEKSKLTLPITKKKSETLKAVIEQFDSEFKAVGGTLEELEEKGAAFEKVIEGVVERVGSMKAFKERYGAEVITRSQFLARSIQKIAEACSLTCSAEEKIASAPFEGGGAGDDVLWLGGGVMPLQLLGKRSQHLHYLVCTLKNV